MKEATLQKQAIKYISSRGGYVLNIWGNPMMRRGIPDLIVGYRGHFVAIELKVLPHGKIAPIQKHELQKVQDAGCLAVVAWNMTDIKGLFEQIDMIIDGRPSFTKQLTDAINKCFGRKQER